MTEKKDPIMDFASLDKKEAQSEVIGDSSRVDPEVAKYASGEIIEIDEETERRLKKKIFYRILPIMTISYFLQSLDKGTISFSSIMNLPEDIGLVGQQVKNQESIGYKWMDINTRYT